MEINWSLVLTLAILALIIWKYWRMKKMQPVIQEYLQKNALVIDVRSPEEFKSGHGEGSLNIPLPSLEAKLSELDKTQPTIVCCASGGRSAMALTLLQKHGFTQVINAGPWQNAVKT